MSELNFPHDDPEKIACLDLIRMDTGFRKRSCVRVRPVFQLCEHGLDLVAL